MTDLNVQALALSKSLTDTAFKAHNLAVQGLERVANLQLKTLEGRLAAAAEFFSEAAEERDVDNLKTLMPKGIGFMKESAEKLYANGQEILGIMTSTSQVISQLAKDSFELTSDTVKKQVNDAASDFAAKTAGAAKKKAA